MVYSRRSSAGDNNAGSPCAYPLSMNRGLGYHHGGANNSANILNPMSALDLEAGGTSYNGGKRQSRSNGGGIRDLFGVGWRCRHLLLSRGGSGAACGRNWGWIAASALQAVVIVVLVLRVRRAEAAGVRGYLGAPGRTGPTVKFVDDQVAQGLEHLIMVPGHGVTIRESLDGADRKDEAWFLLDYQKDKDVPRAIVGHIKGGLDELDADESALLLFSGGKTRISAGPRSEAESYFFVADHFDWWRRPELRARASTEDFARDSFENLLFSICRFKEVTGDYPTKITVVGYDFKKERFDDLHRTALRFPQDAFYYIGMHPSGRFDHEAAKKGEKEEALVPYRSDPYGCAAGGSLAKKRIERDPFHRTAPYGLVCPEMREILEWCGPGVFSGDLPWSEATRTGDEVVGEGKEGGGGLPPT